MSRRLTRELGKLKPGDEVDLRVYGSGQTRALKVKTVSSDSLYRTRSPRSFDDDDRAALGVALGSDRQQARHAGRARHADSTTMVRRPRRASRKAIASPRSTASTCAFRRDDAGDEMLGTSRVRRLQRELEKIKPGDEVDAAGLLRRSNTRR